MQNNDEDPDSENRYCFFPVNGNESDAYTEELFGDLEEGAGFYTDILDSIKSGANLFAKKISGDYVGSHPLHIAAHNVASNSEAINQILKSFSSAEERKRCIELKDDQGSNVLDILIQNRGEFEELSVPNLVSVLTYLTPDEQTELISELSDTSKRMLRSSREEVLPSVSCQQDIRYLRQIYDLFYKRRSFIEMCQQRKKELAETQSGYDSGDEGLGSLKTVENRKFTARISYSKVNHGNGHFEFVPHLSLIPSDWRLQTAVDGAQGDHVTAYVLLLSSLSHCKGEYIKLLPDVIYNMACRVLPDHLNYFLQKKQEVEDELNEHRLIRVEAVASLRTECDKNENFMRSVENNLKKTEVECVARHIEDVVDNFITIINGMEGESFSHSRKEKINISFILQKMSSLVSLQFNGKYSQIVAEIETAINNYPTEGERSITDKLLKAIATNVLERPASWVSSSMMPPQLKGTSGKLTQNKLVNFLKNITPLKKYHEGYAIKAIKNYIIALEKADCRSDVLANIGLECAKLFDYPRVGDPKLDDEYILYQAIPRHMIIINSAFRELAQLRVNEKQIIYDNFLDHILDLQLWLGHPVVNRKGETTTLDLSLLKERILEFSVLDVNHNFSMKPLEEHPSHLHAPRPTRRIVNSSLSQTENPPRIRTSLSINR